MTFKIKAINVETSTMACGRWQVVGGRWQVAGGRWQVSGGRWQVAGGSTPMSEEGLATSWVVTLVTSYSLTLTEQ